MHPYVNKAFGPARELSRPEAKNDRSMLTLQRRQWDTSEELTTLKSSSIALAPLKNGANTPKITPGPYSSLRRDIVN
jgi:hypothetical protein